MQILNHRIGRMSVASPVLEALGSPLSVLESARLLVTVIRYFFWPQYETSLNRRKRPVVNVDHPLDEEVPFRPELVGEYLTFFFLWIKTARWLRDTRGRHSRREGARHFRAHLSYARVLYEDCGKVYLRRQSTTRRPQKSANAGFSLIHSLDPHLHCVPSLHVLLVLANWLRARDVTSAREVSAGGRHAADFGRGRRERAMAYLRQEAVRITESILFVKQHSVNCIGASMFYLSLAFPDFGREPVKEFVESLFTYEGKDLAARQAVRDRVMELYGQLMADHEGRRETRWERTILRWLRTIPANPPY